MESTFLDCSPISSRIMITNRQINPRASHKKLTGNLLVVRRGVLDCFTEWSAATGHRERQPANPVLRGHAPCHHWLPGTRTGSHYRHRAEPHTLTSHSQSADGSTVASTSLLLYSSASTTRIVSSYVSCALYSL